MSYKDILKQELKVKFKSLIKLMEEEKLELNPDKKPILQERIDLLKREIETLESDIKRYDNYTMWSGEHLYQDLQKNWLDYNLLIDFHEYFEAFSKAMNIPTLKVSKHAAHLYLIPSYQENCGDIYIERIKKWLKSNSQQLWIYCPQNFNMFNLNPVAILNEFCSELNIDRNLPEHDKRQLVISSMKARFRNMETSLIIINIETTITKDILDWFLDFWRDLTLDIDKKSQAQPYIRLVAFIAVTNAIDETCATLCAEPDGVVHQTFVMCPLPTWQMENIQDWLLEYSGLLKYKSLQDIENFARVIVDTQRFNRMIYRSFESNLNTFIRNIAYAHGG